MSDLHGRIGAATASGVGAVEHLLALKGKAIVYESFARPALNARIFLQ